MTLEPGLHGLMVDLINNYDPSSTGHPTTSSRQSLATEDDALRASIELGRWIEALRDQGAITESDAHAMSALLLTVRDFVLPLPEQRFLDADPEVDRTRAYLEAAIRDVRRGAL